MDGEAIGEEKVIDQTQGCAHMKAWEKGEKFGMECMGAELGRSQVTQSSKGGCVRDSRRKRKLSRSKDR